MEYTEYQEYPQYYKQKPKYKKLKIFGIIFGLMVIILLSISVFSYNNYKATEETKNLEQTRLEIQSQLSQVITEKEVKKPDPSIKNPLTTVNPRHSYQNSSGDEVAFIAHDGSMGGIANITFTNSLNGYGFFRYLGSSATRIVKGWFSDIDVSGTVNSTYVNGTQIYEGGNRIAINSSLSLYDTWAYNQTTATYNLYNAIWTATFNQTYDNAYQNIIANQSNWLSTYNSTYATQVNYQCPTGQVVNGSNSTGGFTCIAVTSGTYNSTYDLTSSDVAANRSSWASTYNSSYVPYTGATGNVSLGNYNISAGNLYTFAGGGYIKDNGTALILGHT